MSVNEAAWELLDALRGADFARGSEEQQDARQGVTMAREKLLNALTVAEEAKPTEPVPTKRSCNQHDDCDEADKEHRKMWSNRPAKHCSIEDCEDCFGQ